MSNENEIEEEIKQKYAKNGKNLNLNVRVDSETLKKSLQRQNELETELEAERTEKENLESKLRIIAEKVFFDKRKALGAPDSITTVEELREWEQSREPPVGRGASGNLKLTPAQYGRSSEGYDSVEDMIYTLSERAKKGDKLAQEQKQALEQKFFNAIKSGDLPKILYDENKPEFKDEPSIIKKVLERENERVRQKLRESRGDN